MADLTLKYETLISDINIGDKITVSYEKASKKISIDKTYQIIGIVTETIEQKEGKDGYTTIQLGNV